MADILTAILADPHQVDDTAPTLPADIAYSRASRFLARQRAETGILGGPNDFRRRYESDARIRNIVARIDRVEEQIEIATAARNRLENLLHSLFTDKIVGLGEGKIEVRLANDQQIDIGALSSGEKQLLRILLDVISVGPSTVLIDEPEISMHVDWQRQLVPAMRALNPEAQLILATHSPEVMADIDDSRIYEL